MLDNPVKIGIDYAATFSGITVIQSPHCTREKWNFPPSKYRSKRLHKKLVKRFGGQRVIVPAMYRMKQSGREVLVAHPDIFRRLKEECAAAVDRSIMGGIGAHQPKSEPLTPFKLRQAALLIQGPA